MRIGKLWASSAAVALALGLAVSAKAETVTITFSGVVSSGLDGAGDFGGGDLTGDSYDIVYTIQDPMPAGVSDFSVPPYSTSLRNFPVATSVTINGFTVTAPPTGLNGGKPGEMYQSTLASGLADIWYDRDDDGSVGGGIRRQLTISEEVDSTINSFIPSYDYRTPFTYSVQPGDGTPNNDFIDWTYDAPSLETIRDTEVRFTPTTVTVAVADAVAGVPEPATWALLILGVGMIGFAARRRGEGAGLLA